LAAERFRRVKRLRLIEPENVGLAGVRKSSSLASGFVP
jgi:hypothetical protein